METLNSRQKEIICAATKLISEKGIQSMTVKNLSEAIGVTESALYRHFKNKNDILLTILKDYEENCKEILKKINDSKCYPFESVKKLFIARCEDFKKNPDMISILFSDEIFKNEPKLAKKLSDITGMHEAFIKNAIYFAAKNKEIRNDIPEGHIVFIIMGALRLLVNSWKMRNYDFDLVARAEGLWDSIEILIKKEK